MRLEVASQGPAQRTSASGDAGETTELVSVPEIAKTFQLSFQAPGTVSILSIFL